MSSSAWVNDAMWLDDKETVSLRDVLVEIDNHEELYNDFPYSAETIDEALDYALEGLNNRMMRAANSLMELLEKYCMADFNNEVTDLDGYTRIFTVGYGATLKDVSDVIMNNDNMYLSFKSDPIGVISSAVKVIADGQCRNIKGNIMDDRLKKVADMCNFARIEGNKQQVSR